MSSVKIWVFEFCYNLSLSFVTIWVFDFCHNLSFCVWSQFELLILVTIRICEFCHNLSGQLLSQFEFLTFCHYLTFWVLSHFQRRRKKKKRFFFKNKHHVWGVIFFICEAVKLHVGSIIKSLANFIKTIMKSLASVASKITVSYPLFFIIICLAFLIRVWAWPYKWVYKSQNMKRMSEEGQYQNP